MLAYILRRLLLMIPTILGIMAVSFAIVQFVPGGPVERAIAQLQGADQSSTAQFGGGGGQIGSGAAQAGGDITSRYRGSQGLDPKFIKELEKQYGFDKPALERFWILVRDYSTFNFGKSYYRDVPVLELIKEKLPVSISLGMWMTVLSYAISIPLGVRKAVKDGSRFDTVTSALVIFGYAIPSFLFAVLLVVLFCGGSFWQIFPLRGLTSDNFADLSWPQKILDYLWHITLPVTSLVLGLVRDLDATHEEFLPRRDQEILRADRAHEGPDRTARALWPRVPQRDADRHRRLPRRLHRRVLHRLPSDRTGVLARRARLSLLQFADPARLSGGARQPLYLRADRPCGEPDFRPHLHLDRSSHRFRNARGVSLVDTDRLALPSDTAPQPGEAATRRPSARTKKRTLGRRRKPARASNGVPGSRP